MIGQQKNNRILYHQNYRLIEKPVITFWNPHAFHNYLGIFETYKCSGIALFLQSSRYVSNDQSCLKTTGLYGDLLLLSSLFHFFYFIFSAPISFSLCFPISPSLFLLFFLKFLSSIVEKLLYTYIHIDSMCNMTFDSTCLT